MTTIEGWGRVTNQSVDTPQGSVAYSASGAGDVIVLLPGFQSDRNGWIRSGYLELLSDWRLLNVDPIGHGLSAKPHDESAYTPDAVVAHVCAVLDAEDVESAHIWGFSRGGSIAGLCAELAPERCTSVIMGGTPLGDASAVTLPPLASGEPFLADGDWKGYWASYPLPLPSALITHFESTNDPLANSAAIRALLSWNEKVPNHGLNPGPVPRLAYYGQGELFAEPLRNALAASPIESHEGPWAGHAETMMDAPGVVDVVLPFLAGAAGR